MKDPASIFELSTDCLPHNERIACWREQYGHVLLRVDLEPAKDVAFRASMKSLSLSGLQIFEASSSPARLSRTGEHLADGDDYAGLIMNRMGIAAVSSGGREQILREQEAILIMGNEPGSYYRPNPGQSLTVRVPRHLLRSLVADPDDAFMRVIPRTRSSLGLLSHYAGWLLKTGGSLDSELLKLSARHIQDLLALTLGANSDFKEIAKTRGLRAARLKLSKTHIIAHSNRREISIGSVATHFCVTPRYLQRLFEEDGTTFSEFLVMQRLAQAHQRLCEPDCSGIPISTIAYDCGFGDLSYFNRRFRRAYGLTPREARGERAPLGSIVLA
jgi:AraC-like DNA-binding protein